jgi:hypothetical protein
MFYEQGQRHIRYTETVSHFFSKIVLFSSLHLTTTQNKSFMNQFMIIVKGKDPISVSPEEMQERMNKFGAWVQNILSGRYVSGGPLDENEGRLLKSKKEILTDGPFMDSKEMIAGHFIINATDIDEATELTKECPLLDQFVLEVRKLKKMD